MTPIKTPKEVVIAFAQWAAAQDGHDSAAALASLDEEPKIMAAFLELVALAREGVRDAALEDAARLCDAKAWSNTARLIREMKGAA